MNWLKEKDKWGIFLFWRSSEPQKDGIISTYEEHEDSVYAVDWSAADPWVFASLSYDGRLVINRVPRAEKYKILLWYKLQKGGSLVIVLYVVFIKLFYWNDLFSLFSQRTIITPQKNMA